MVPMHGDADADHIVDLHPHHLDETAAGAATVHGTRPVAAAGTIHVLVVVRHRLMVVLVAVDQALNIKQRVVRSTGDGADGQPFLIGAVSNLPPNRTVVNIPRHPQKSPGMKKTGGPLPNLRAWKAVRVGGLGVTCMQHERKAGVHKFSPHDNHPFLRRCVLFGDFAVGASDHHPFSLHPC